MMSDDHLSPDGEAYLNKTQLAQGLDVSLPTIDDWMSDDFEGGMPCEQGGGNGKAYKFLLSRCEDWRDRRSGHFSAIKEQQQAEITRRQSALDLQGGGADGVDALTSEQRKKYYESELTRMKADEARGNLCRADAVERELEAIFMALSRFLQSLPDQLAHECNLDPGVVGLVQEKTVQQQAMLARMLMERDDLNDVA